VCKPQQNNKTTTTTTTTACLPVVCNLLAGQFWDTAPAYSGQREVWDALRAACEMDDDRQARAIIEAMSLRLPDGVCRGLSHAALVLMASFCCRWCQASTPPMSHCVAVACLIFYVRA